MAISSPLPTLNKLSEKEFSIENNIAFLPFKTALQLMIVALPQMQGNTVIMFDECYAISAPQIAQFRDCA